MSTQPPPWMRRNVIHYTIFVDCARIVRNSFLRVHCVYCIIINNLHYCEWLSVFVFLFFRFPNINDNENATINYTPIVLDCIDSNGLRIHAISHISLLTHHFWARPRQRLLIHDALHLLDHLPIHCHKQWLKFLFSDEWRRAQIMLIRWKMSRIRTRYVWYSTRVRMRCVHEISFSLSGIIIIVRNVNDKNVNVCHRAPTTDKIERQSNVTNVMWIWWWWSTSSRSCCVLPVTLCVLCVVAK